MWICCTVFIWPPYKNCVASNVGATVLHKVSFQTFCAFSLKKMIWCAWNWVILKTLLSCLLFTFDDCSATNQLYTYITCVENSLKHCWSFINSKNIFYKAPYFKHQTITWKVFLHKTVLTHNVHGHQHAHSMHWGSIVTAKVSFLQPDLLTVIMLVAFYSVNVNAVVARASKIKS